MYNSNPVYRFFMQYCKRTIAIIMILLGLITPVATYAQNFSDVPGDHKNQTAISYLSDMGVISGYNDGSFHPGSLINRAEFTKIVMAARFGSSAIDNCISDKTMPSWSYLFFYDVSLNEWYSKYICSAATNKIINGYPDSTFRPSDAINFAEALKVIINAYNIDVSRVRVIHNSLLYINDSDWFASYFSYAYNKNLINRDKFYHPAQLMTRGEMAEILYRLNSITESGADEFTTDEQPYSDEYTITIPRLNIINLNVSFADPYDSKEALDVLKDGLGHYLSPPGDGKKLVLFGHSSGYSWDHSAYKTVLRQINKIQTGDDIYINYHERGYAYQVYKQEILPAGDLGVVMKDYGYEELALYTCWPPDSIKQRYVVYAAPL